MLFDELQVWMDPVARSGPETMAVDEWLLETAEKPVLRVYRWLGDWGSIGYFGKIVEAKMAIPGLDWVRRWTGGGTVDHRADWTYTLVSPPCPAISRGAESYRVIHSALVEALKSEELEARLSGGESETGSAVCFANPVSHDIVDSHGGKIAGAGQKRIRSGFLHQGSLAIPAEPGISRKRAAAFAGCLAKSWSFTELEPPPERVAVLSAGRYAKTEWTEKR